METGAQGYLRKRFLLWSGLLSLGAMSLLIEAGSPIQQK
jgi:hypothetical protein